ncbi:MAG: lytic transglycosylase domain-containing protein [Chitinophagales bacterium]|nr:lytic transglycosylase domain-containing protein [Chitinophagales bacterium]
MKNEYLFKSLLVVFVGLALVAFTGKVFKNSGESEILLASAEVKPSEAPAILNNDTEPPKEYLKIYSVNVKGDLFFAGERVPLEDFDVRERLDRELHVNTYWHSNTIIMMKIANKYFPSIERILAEEGVPDDFKYLALAESGLRNVRSSAGAMGYWQFLDRTARQYGLIVNDEVDERLHLEKSTRAACKYLKNGYEKFGSWSLAAASYNRGMDGIQRDMNAQKVDSYFDLYLNTETSRYVFRILALKEIFENPSNYGFHLENDDLYYEPKFGVIEVTDPISDLAEYAQKYGTNYKKLKLSNPWLKRTYLKSVSDKNYELKIPLE